MKYHEPRLISFTNAFVVTALYILFFILGSLIISPDRLKDLYLLLYLVVSAMILFLVSFFVFRFTLEKFIYSKIRLIYKSIHNIKRKKDEGRHQRIDSRLLDEVNQEVEEWQLEKSEEIEQLRQLEKYRREFIGNVSHELKTPLFNIQGYILTLLDGGLEDSSVNMEYLRRTEKSIERLIQVVEDLDEIAQLESGQIQLRIIRFDLVALTKEVIELLEMKADKKGIKLACSRQDKPVYVEGDQEKIRQVLTNLIENSIRYGSKKGRTKVSFFDMDEYILTEVTDNGIGIEPEEISRVFERFYRAQRGRATFAKGKGLGLAIVKHILEAHHQTVNVRSTIGVGTTFGFTMKKV
ncbi:MAG: sensor histidine kinase [Bacteroidales bacterium]|nr:sensor histidine kinase [Bacteroidales bacterium]